MISVKIDTSDIKQKFSDLPSALLDSIRIEMKNQITKVQETARKNHRYQTHTRKLEESVQTRILKDGLIGQIYLENSIADYGVYVHEGHGTWDPDRFLDEAIERQETEINEAMGLAIQEGIRKAGF